MPTFAVLLRAVNVGGNNKLPMADFRAMLTKLGFADVATYIQSGNAVVTGPKAAPAEVATKIERALAKTFSLDVRAVVRTRDALAALVAAGHPFGAKADPKRVHVVFLSAAPTKDAASRLDPRRSPADVFVVRGAELHLHTPDGMGKSKLTMPWFEKLLGVTGTARNWNTVLELARLAEPR